MTQKIALFVLLLVLAGTSCKNTQPDHDTMSISRIEYRFRDSSVPPKYHRSYTILVNKKEISAKVDSYGEVLGETSETLASGKFKDILQLLKVYQIENRKAKNDDGCTGGTTESISWWTDAEEPSFNGSVYHCGGSDFGDLSGDTKAFGADLKALLPELQAIISQ